MSSLRLCSTVNNWGIWSIQFDIYYWPFRASHFNYQILFPGEFNCHSGTYEGPYKRGLHLACPCVLNSSAVNSSYECWLIMLACKAIITPFLIQGYGNHAWNETMYMVYCTHKVLVTCITETSYPPCVTIHFPWCKRTDVASSSSWRATINP